jgi:hypothetical protein
MREDDVRRVHVAVLALHPIALLKALGHRDLVVPHGHELIMATVTGWPTKVVQ